MYGSTYVCELTYTWKPEINTSCLLPATLVFESESLNESTARGSASLAGLPTRLFYVNAGDQTHFFRAGEKTAQ